MEDASIKLTNLAKSYRGQDAVHNLNVDVKKGELFGFLGPNGAGKTTTIKMLTGLLEPTSGSAHINDVDIWKNPIEAKKKIAYVPDQPNLYPKLTGWDYLEFIASVFQVPQEKFQSKAKELLQIFSLTEQANDLIESYSHGMKQKIAICGALVHEPEVLFLDEPTVGLDPKSARSLKNLLRELCDNGMTAFVSTHILEIAEQMCDRVGIILDGKIIALGTMDELRSSGGNLDQSLEDIFLELTGGEDHQALISEITDQGDPK
ncbi:ABC-2 type transport system ATP-binding protein [Virgibacillus subterraneus]|uniref:ABC-2 type transport system ATP-binding protein n=2 Tax=Virgibacillus TaxID=84406 RepID=A0A1H1DKS6_9BACI|nr:MULTISPECIES: ABC transporter ATP-binding protein [Virgibacillus]SDQ77131.1 ABC-2 type transport system ATP-binding protein [Virgibacillus salinus]SEQ91521.1 ABC-2 type transport system ATP-binding protein [Virgibacillus subterraneus]